MIFVDSEPLIHTFQHTENLVLRNMFFGVKNWKGINESADFWNNFPEATILNIIVPNLVV